MTQFTCRERLEAAFAMRSTQFEAPPGNTIHFQGVSGINVCGVFYMVRASTKCANHLQGASGINVRVVSYMFRGSTR